MMKFDVIGVGCLTVDIFAESSVLIVEFKKAKKETFIALPEGKMLSQIIVRTGGSSGNTVAYLSKLGLRCGYFTKLGTDYFSDFLIEDLKSFGVDVSRIIRVKGLEAGKSIIVSSLGFKDTALLVDHGAADKLTKKDIEENLDYLLSTKWLDISSFTSKEAIEAIEFLVKKAKKENVKIFFAPSRTMISTFRKDALKLMRYADAFSMNEREAALLSGKDNLADMLKFFKKMKIPYFFVTRSAKGLVCFYKNKFYKIGAYRVREVKNTTGAGDIVAAWLIYGLIKKMDVKDIMNFASVAGAFHVKKDYIGAKDGLASYHEIKRFLDRVRNLPVRTLRV